MADEEEQQCPGSTTTRTTRMIFVEEISDNENENVEKRYKSIEMKTKVVKEASPKTQRKSNAKSPTDQRNSPTLGKENNEPSNSGHSMKTDHIADVADMNVMEKLEEEMGKVDAFRKKETDKNNSQAPERNVSQVNASMAFDSDSVVMEGDAPIPKKSVTRRRFSKAPMMEGGRKVLSVESGMGMAGSRGPKAMHVHDELSSVANSLLYSKLGVLIIFMKIAGLFFVRKKISHHSGLRGFLLNCTALQGYCILMISLLSVNFVRSLWMFDGSEEFGSLLFFKLLVIIFFYEAVSRAFLAFMACWNKKDGILTLFRSLETICYPDNIIPYEDSLRKMIIYMLILSFVVSISNVAALGYGFFGPPDIRAVFSIYHAPFKSGRQSLLGFEIANLIITFVNSMVAMLSLTFYTICCYVLHKEFEYFSRTFTMKISPDGLFLDDLERFRIRHQRRCKIVEEADRLFKYYIANTYMTNVPLLCLLLYSVVYTDASENQFSMRVVSVYRMAYVFLQMMVLSVVATMINTQAHAPLSNIYSVRIQNADTERQMEMTMFLNKLTGTQIGLTAWDMFVINKPTVLTVVGMILTYFFLLVQFKNPLQGATVCNCYFSPNGTNYSLPVLNKD